MKTSYPPKTSNSSSLNQLNYNKSHQSFYGSSEPTVLSAQAKKNIPSNFKHFEGSTMESLEPLHPPQHQLQPSFYNYPHSQQEFYFEPQESYFLNFPRSQSLSSYPVHPFFNANHYNNFDANNQFYNYRHDSFNQSHKRNYVEVCGDVFNGFNEDFFIENKGSHFYSQHHDSSFNHSPATHSIPQIHQIPDVQPLITSQKLHQVSEHQIPNIAKNANIEHRPIMSGDTRCSNHINSLESNVANNDSGKDELNTNVKFPPKSKNEFPIQTENRFDNYNHCDNIDNSNNIKTNVTNNHFNEVSMAKNNDNTVKHTNIDNKKVKNFKNIQEKSYKMPQCQVEISLAVSKQDNINSNSSLEIQVFSKPNNNFLPSYFQKQNLISQTAQNNVNAFHTNFEKPYQQKAFIAGEKYGEKNTLSDKTVSDIPSNTFPPIFSENDKISNNLLTKNINEPLTNKTDIPNNYCDNQKQAAWNSLSSPAPLTAISPKDKSASNNDFENKAFIQRIDNKSNIFDNSNNEDDLEDEDDANFDDVLNKSPNLTNEDSIKTDSSGIPYYPWMSVVGSLHDF